MAKEEKFSIRPLSLEEMERLYESEQIESWKKMPRSLVILGIITVIVGYILQHYFPYIFLEVSIIFIVVILGFAILVWFLVRYFVKCYEKGIVEVKNEIIDHVFVGDVFGRVGTHIRVKEDVYFFKDTRGREFEKDQEVKLEVLECRRPVTLDGLFIDHILSLALLEAAMSTSKATRMVR
jgi:uncharacterized membrane protein